MKVVIVKLQNNTEIIARLVSQKEGTLVIDNPFTINYVMSAQTDRPMVGLLRYMSFADSRQITFKTRDIIHVMDARESMSKYYDVILKTHEVEIDESVDRELEDASSLDFQEESEQDATDILAAMLEKIKPNTNLH